LEFHRLKRIVLVGRETSNVRSNVGGDGNQCCGIGAQDTSVKDVSSVFGDGKKRNNISLFRPILNFVISRVEGRDIHGSFVLCQVVFVLLIWLFAVIDNKTKSSDQCVHAPIEVRTDETLVVGRRSQVRSFFQFSVICIFENGNGSIVFSNG